MISVISRILAFFMMFTTMFLPAKADGVQVTVRDISTSDAAITFECENGTNRRIGRPYIEKIERNVDGEWEEVNIGLGWTEIYYYVYPGQSCVESAEFGFVDETGFTAQHLQAGEYRLTISYDLLNVLKGQLETGESSAVFTVTQA